MSLPATRTPVSIAKKAREVALLPGRFYAPGGSGPFGYDAQGLIAFCGGLDGLAEMPTDTILQVGDILIFEGDAAGVVLISDADVQIAAAGDARAPGRCWWTPSWHARLRQVFRAPAAEMKAAA